MRFCEQLNEYITRLDCRGKELAEAAGLSAPSLSRYRTGERTPGRGSAVLTALSDALADMAKAKALPDMDADTLYSAFLQCDEYAGTDKKMLRENFNALIEVMGLSVAKLCRCANYDPSAIFRFRRGERQPAEPEQFAAAVASYVSREMDGPAQREVAAALLGCAAEDLSDRAAYCRRVQDWLLGSHAPREDSVSRFLTKLDEFDLNAYIRSVHFDELKVPVAPFQLPTSRSYSGLRQMMDSELDFMKAAVLQRHDVPAPDQEHILVHAKSRREQAETILRDNEMVLALPQLTEEAFERYPMSLPLSGSFYERDIPYTYQEYLEHIDQTEQFAAVHPRCRLELTADSTFRNLQIVMHEGRWAMVSKEKSPAIHFVIRHAKLRSAIESFEPPLVEE